MNTKEPATSPDAIHAEAELRDPNMKSAIDAALTTLEERNAHPYDGLNGQLPDWIPAPLIHEFKAVRNRLLDSVSIDDLQNWMQLWRSPTPSGPAHVPPEYDRDIDSLVYIQSIVKLGQQAGINAYLGKGGMEVVRGMARVEHNRKAAQQPRPDGLTRVIRQLVLGLPEGEPAGQYVEQRLRKLVHTEVDGVTIETIDNDVIEWCDAHGKVGSAPLSGLKDRVSRVQEQLQKEKLD